MIGELKRGIKLIKYGFNLKSSILVALLFFIMGIVISIMNPTVSLLGGTYIMLGPLMSVQIVSMLTCANSVAASSYKRILEIWIPNLAAFLSIVFGYSFIIVITALKIRKTPLLETDNLRNLVCIGVLACVLGIYMSTAYKSFFVSIFLFTVAYMFVYFSTDILLEVTKIHLTVLSAALIGFGFILLGSVLSFMLSKAFYKKPISKYAVGGAFRKYM